MRLFPPLHLTTTTAPIYLLFPIVIAIGSEPSSSWSKSLIRNLPREMRIVLPDYTSGMDICSEDLLVISPFSPRCHRDHNMPRFYCIIIILLNVSSSTK